MKSIAVESQYSSNIRRRCQSLESKGYVLVADNSQSVGELLEDLLRREFGRKEYVIVPNDSHGSSHRIYARNIIDVVSS